MYLVFVLTFLLFVSFIVGRKKNLKFLFHFFPSFLFPFSLSLSFFCSVLNVFHATKQLFHRNFTIGRGPGVVFLSILQGVLIAIVGK